MCVGGVVIGGDWWSGGWVVAKLPNHITKKIARDRVTPTSRALLLQNFNDYQTSHK